MAQASTQSVQGTALITGASSGIGCEFAFLMAREGYDLVLVSRNRAALETVAAQCVEAHGVKVEICVKDLSTPGAAAEIFADLRLKGVAIDVLINDAGFAMQGPFVENELASLLDMLQVNIVALTHLTRLFLPEMIRRGRGRILNMASIGAFMPGPMMAAYFASKAFVLSLSEALANELRGTGVTATAVCAGPTRTKFAHRARLTDTKAFQGDLMDPADLARQALEAMLKGKQVLITPFKYRLQLLPTPLLPRRLMAHFARQYHLTSAQNGAKAVPVWTPGPDEQPVTPIAHS